MADAVQADGRHPPRRRPARPRAHDEVIRHVEEQILDGTLRPGDRLPPERELSEQLGMSRGSLREGMRVLESLGVVRIRPGQGQESGTIVTDGFGTELARLLRMHVNLQHTDAAVFTEARAIIESSASRIAAERIDDDGVRRLTAVLDEMDDTSISSVAFNELDTRFHLSIAEVCGNEMLSLLMHAIRDAIKQQMIHRYAELPDWRATARTVRAEHRAILAAIAAGAVEEAGRLTHEHIVSFYR